MTGGELVGTAAFALGAGVATFFSPCSYALLPGYVGYYVSATGRESPPLGGAVARGVAAAAGAILVLGILSAVALVAGDTLERVLPTFEYAVGVALIGLGGWIVAGGPGAIHGMLPKRRSSVLGFGLFGGMYALAATACVLPLFLGIVLRTFTMSTLEGAFVLGAYVAGFAALLLAVTVATAVGHAIGAGRLTGYVDRLVRAGGVVLVLAGFGQLYVAA
ncbi:cytochrome c biogenesis CcdA family protein [Halobiforma nitratireducens]|uniref:Cytochrome c-type biogenesis protein n=1 Tax=Halobiforma nitratireducens JCM 10879 TaxID=1227454 RepID=M0L5S7_9EURY|nr:cytochrome c biogenesis protein CcdA [Halobiforma nitratireducens]EMA27345.1 cytochrome c-type biogenesis protein [Halobiforma nitratireducens JCM 10879]